jgi:hypothetical protein
MGVKDKLRCTNLNPAGVQFCSLAATGRSLPGNVKFCCKIQHLWDLP